MRDPNVVRNSSQSRILNFYTENPSKEHVGLQLQCERTWGSPVGSNTRNYYWKLTVAGIEPNSLLDNWNSENLDIAISEGDELISLQRSSLLELTFSPDGKFTEVQRHIIDSLMTSTVFRSSFRTHAKTEEKLHEEFRIFIHELGHHLGHPDEKDILLTLMAGKASGFALKVAALYCQRVQIGRVEEGQTLSSDYYSEKCMCKLCALEGHTATREDAIIRARHHNARWMALDEDASILIETRAISFSVWFCS